MIQDPTLIFAFLAVTIALLFQASRWQPLQPLFQRMPPIVWAYFLPMLATTVGLLPDNSPLYGALRRFLLPASLALLLTSADLRSIARLGRNALLVMVAGMLGTAVGITAGFFALRPWLPADAWKGLGALTGSWIGGSANLITVGAAVDISPDLQGVIILVDTVVGYGYMGILISLAPLQDRFDRWNRADRSVVDDLNRRLEKLRAERSRPATTADVALMFGLAAGLTVLSLQVGAWLPPVGKVLGPFSWAIVVLTTVTLLLSLTRLARIEEAGASAIGYAGFYLLLAGVGAQGNLRHIVDHPQFALVGVIAILCHAAALLLAVRLLRAPLFFFGTASQACVGGYASAPIVATVYQSAMAPVGLLLAVLGNVAGTYIGLLVSQLLSMA